MMVRFAEAAEIDLERIGDSLGAFDSARALAIIREMRRCCAGLADVPLGFPLVPRREETRVRRRVHRQYLIFYRIEGDDVVIVRSLHGAMDYEPILFPTD